MYNYMDCIVPQVEFTSISSEFVVLIHSILGMILYEKKIVKVM